MHINQIMKRDFRLIVLLAAVLSSSLIYAGAEEMEPTAGIPVRKPARELRVSTDQVGKPLDLEGKSLKGMRKADGNNSEITGNWTFTFGDYYSNVAIGAEIEAEYEATLEGNRLTFSDTSGAYFNMVAYYDEVLQDLTFLKEYLQIYRGYYLYQFPFEYEGPNQFRFKSITAFFDPENGRITFDPVNGIYWGGANDEAGNNLVGYFRIYELVDAEKSTVWLPLGEGSWLENIAYGFFTGGQRNGAFVTVQVEESEKDPGVFRIQDAFASLYSKAFLGGRSPSMTLDARDPSNVIIDLQPTGLNAILDNEDRSAIYYLNDAAFFNEFGWSLNQNGVKRCTLTSGEEKALKIVIPTHSCLLYASASTDYFFGSAYESVLEFAAGETSIDALESDEPDMPEAYYNLQGIKVERPQRGEIVIVRQGKNCKKIVYQPKR